MKTRGAHANRSPRLGLDQPRPAHSEVGVDRGSYQREGGLPDLGATPCLSADLITQRRYTTFLLILKAWKFERRAAPKALNDLRDERRLAELGFKS